MSLPEGLIDELDLLQLLQQGVGCFPLILKTALKLTTKNAKNSKMAISDSAQVDECTTFEVPPVTSNQPECFLVRFLRLLL